MLKVNKRKLLKNKSKLINHYIFFNYQLYKFLRKNNSIQNKFRVKYFKFFLKSYKYKLCLMTGKGKATHNYLKLNRSICNSFLKFNYLPNLKIFGQ